MPKRLSYSTVSKVVEIWELAKSKPNFEEKVGTDLLLKYVPKDCGVDDPCQSSKELLSQKFFLVLFRMFELEPRTKRVFHFELTYNPTPEALKESGNVKFAIQMLESFDACLSMLGPETEILYEILEDIGKRHVSYGVSPHFFPFFGQAMVYALSNLLGDYMTPELREVWLELYDSFSGIVMKAILDVHLERMMPSANGTRRNSTQGTPQLM